MNKLDENKIRVMLTEAMEKVTEQIAEDCDTNFYWHADTPSRMAESALQIILALDESETERQKQED